MDIMIEHPWSELQVLIKEKWLTQKAFSSVLWKKVSEVNELLKWKRNITIQRDYLLHQTLWTPIKYWILKQVDYDYSLLNIDKTGHSTRHSGLSENSEISPIDKGDMMKPGEFEQSQEAPIKEKKNENNEDFKKRANIFRSF